MAFDIGRDGILRNQGRLSNSNVKGLQERILAEALESTYTVHLGSTKIYHDLKEIYWWFTMKKDVANFMAMCMVCQ